MEVPQRHSLCDYLKQAKTSFFSFSFFLIQNQKTEWWTSDTTGRGWGKGEVGSIWCNLLKKQ
jgi:hypothetical protein